MRTFIKNLDWTSADSTFCLYRLLLLITWDSNSIKETPSEVNSIMAKTFARMFEENIVPPFLMRKMVNRWVLWAVEITNEMCSIWTRQSAPYYREMILNVVNTVKFDEINN